MKKTLCILLSLFASGAYAQTVLNNINLPQAPQFSQGTDRIRAADGTECSRSTGPRRKYMDVGVLAGAWGGQGVENQYPIIYANSNTAPPNNYNRAGGAAYSRMIINLDDEGDNYQVDCGKLYDLELERLKTEMGQNKLMEMGGGKNSTKPVGTDK